MEVYELLDLILYSPVCVNRLPLIGEGIECMHWANVSTKRFGFMWYIRMGQKEQQRFSVDAVGVGTWLKKYLTG